MHFASFAILGSLVGVLGGSPLRHSRRFSTDLDAGEASDSWKRQSTTYEPHTIDQLIDHFPHDDRYLPHTNGTFKQYYYFDATFYKPGGPVFLYIGGETSGPSRFSNLRTGIVQILMSTFGGLGVILENRYYGRSWPVTVSTTDNLVYLTNEQTIADIAYFAQHATFPGVNATLQAPNTPYILYGGSLAGAQTAFAVKTYGDVLYGGIASSGVIYTMLEYPQWYAPVQKYGPGDCIASVNGIVDKFDGLVRRGDKAAIEKFKSLFGLQAVKDIRDFAATIAFPIGGPFDYPGDTWQELNWQVPFSEFWNFCGNVTNVNAPKEITDVDYAMANVTGGEEGPWENLGNYANYVKNAIVDWCPSGDYNGCFGTQNASLWADTSNSGGRSYLYTTCIEAGLYQVAPEQGPTLLSRVVGVEYTQEWCRWAFAPGKYNKVPSTPDLSRWNGYGGLNFSADRLAFIDGQIDPWLDACYHSSAGPPRQSSDLHPEHLIATGGHHWDSYGIKNVPAEPQFIREAHLFEIRTVTKWLRDFASWKPARNGH